MNIKIVIISATVVLGVIIGAAFLLTGSSTGTASNNSSTQNLSLAKYLPYSDEQLNDANEGKVVIFFHADWCPTCIALDKELREKSNALPSEITILKADFDSERELKKKYGVIQQHTLVQVDAQGNEIKKWIGGGAALIKQQII